MEVSGDLWILGILWGIYFWLFWVWFESVFDLKKVVIESYVNFVVFDWESLFSWINGKGNCCGIW